MRIFGYDIKIVKHADKVEFDSYKTIIKETVNVLKMMRRDISLAKRIPNMPTYMTYTANFSIYSAKIVTLEEAFRNNKFTFVADRMAFSTTATKIFELNEANSEVSDVVCSVNSHILNDCFGDVFECFWSDELSDINEKYDELIKRVFEIISILDSLIEALAHIIGRLLLELKCGVDIIGRHKRNEKMLHHGEIPKVEYKLGFITQGLSEGLQAYDFKNKQGGNNDAGRRNDDGV